MLRALIAICYLTLPHPFTNAFSRSFFTQQRYSKVHQDLNQQRQRRQQQLLTPIAARTSQYHASKNEDFDESERTIATSSSSVENVPAPSFNGKMIIPLKVLMGGLKGHDVAAVYAIYNDEYKKGSDDEGWKSCELIGMTQNLFQSLQSHKAKNDKLAFVRVLSFPQPQFEVMEGMALRWHESVRAAGGRATPITFVEGDDLREEQRMRDATAYLYDDDDDDDDDDDYDDIVSPFDQSQSNDAGKQVTTGETLEFTAENVDKVLEEVRPYLISDGGNVSVQKIDVPTRSVYLVLEGACGSCPSSTTTMKMGIERVLKENFVDLGEVVSVNDGEGDGQTELSLQMVQDEVGRLTPAIMAMGGVIEIVSVEASGTVEIRFRGSEKVKHGLELALRDVPLVTEVKFVD